MTPRPELPRVVDQLRILLWLQMHVTLVGLLILLLVVGYFTNVRDLYLSPEEDTLFISTMGVLIGTAAVLALCATLLRRRWWWVYVLIVAVEAVAVVTIVQTLARGYVVAGLGYVLYVALVAWIVVDLFHPEVRSFMFRTRRT